MTYLKKEACWLIALGMVMAIAIPSLAYGKPDQARPTHTVLRFRLADHNVADGEDATGWIRLLARSEKKFAPLASQTVRVLVDGTEQVTVTTDADGRAEITVSAEAGGHVVRAVFDGSEAYRRAKRTQGLQVKAEGTAEDDTTEQEVEEEIEEEDAE